MSRTESETVPGELAALSAAPVPAAVGPTAASDFDRLATVRLPLVLLVILFHNESGGRFIERLSNAPVLAGVVEWLVHGIGVVRVPAFFLIAGYLFFRNGQASPAWFRRKLNARGRSLLLPLMLWTSLSLAIVAVAQAVPALRGFFNGNTLWSTPVLDMSLVQWVGAYFGAPWELFVYPLWFLRDLFVLVLLAPLIYYLIVVSRGGFTVAMLAWWYLGPHHPLVTPGALCFFVLGSHLALHRTSLEVKPHVGLAVTALWLLMQTNVLDLPEADLGKLKTLAGIVVVLYLSCVLNGMAGVSTFLRDAAARVSLFIFAAHEPLLTFVRKVYLHVFQPEAPWALLLAYFMVVAIVVALIVIAFKLAERWMPRTLNLLTGGRS